MSWLWLVPALPLAGALILAILGGLMPRRAAAAVGCSAVGLSWALAVAVAAIYVSSPPPAGAFRETLFQWMEVGALRIPMGLYLDPLSLVMTLVITFVGFVIHLYSADYMDPHDDYSLFFCYMNLFVGAMLILVLADNLLSLYLGWEGVGLCSYLLIGFRRRERANGVAAQKAFIVTRIGDTSLAVGLFLLFAHALTLDLQHAMRSLAGDISAGAPGAQAVVTAAALLILGGAVAKSAQLPLQTWLPDAMAGPTPVSALIHAATMVTAGVYLIARTHVLFSLSPPAMTLVAIVGAATACYGGLSALAQRDIKRALAYSTISQIGFMFLALGVGAWWAAVFHFMAHAFFKALLFLAAGIVVQALGEERDMSRMGGLFSRLPVAGWTFLIGASSLAALPLVTAGFYSKDAILWASWSYPLGSPLLWSAGALAALLTGLYIFRVFFLVFLGEVRTPVGSRPRFLVKLAVVVLSVCAIVGGFVGVPRPLGGRDFIADFLAPVFGRPPAQLAVAARHALPLLSSLISLFAIWLAYMLFRPPARAPALAVGARHALPLLSSAVHRWLYAGFGFDRVYDRLFVRPYVFLARRNRGDFMEWFFLGLAAVPAGASRLLSATQSGRVRNYATALLVGAVLVVAFLVLR